jgi:hypothetical protein
MRTDLLELVEKLNNLPNNTPIHVDPELNYNEEFSLEPITISCEDKTIVGYIITNKQVFPRSQKDK